jgi:haloacetate dehalogenase
MIPVPFVPGFRRLDAEAGGVRLVGAVGGEGPPVLLLHGYPETHVAWRRIAPALAEGHKVVIPDLPGYGASRPDAMVLRWTKRRAGAALVSLMDGLGHRRFSVAGHDRGARVGYRRALDHPERVAAFASLAVVPTLDALAAVDHRAATKAYHWFFFAQPAPLPEALLAADPDAVIDAALDRMTGGRHVIEPEARDAYRSAFRDPAFRHAICEDYRAALDEDLALDIADREAGRRLSCPVIALWPAADIVQGRPAPDAVWRRWADHVTGVATSGGHLQPEDAAEEVQRAILAFLVRSSRAAA